MVKRYGLDEQQAAGVRELASQLTEAFLKENGPRALDLVERMQAVARFMREGQVSWQEVPEDIKQDLGERALPLLDALQRDLRRFSDGLAKSLDPEQQELLEQDRRQMEGAFGLVRAQALALTGRPPEEGPVPPGTEGQPAGEGPPRPGQPGGTGPGAVRAGVPSDQPERYVLRFIQRYRLDEVQKLRAMDLLAEYKAKAEKLSLSAATLPAATQPLQPPPATAPTSQSAEDLRRRLGQLQQRRRAIGELFEQLKRQLDAIPTPVQRQLAGEEPTLPAGSSRPSTGGAAIR
jgi:hypothetical protein